MSTHIEGTISRTLDDGREVAIPFLIDENGNYFQWGHDTTTLGANVDLLEAIRDAIAEDIG
jgi:hypothetical protein